MYSNKRKEPREFKARDRAIARITKATNDLVARKMAEWMRFYGKGRYLSLTSGMGNTSFDIVLRRGRVITVMGYDYPSGGWVPEWDKDGIMPFKAWMSDHHRFGYTKACRFLAQILADVDDITDGLRLTAPDEATNKPKRVTRIGTSHFVDHYSAVQYYYNQELLSYSLAMDEVVVKLAEGSIHLGKPEVKPGETLELIDGGTRYAIVCHEA